MEHYLTKEHIQEFENWMLQEEKSRATIEKYLRDLRRFYDYLPQEKQVTKAQVIAYKNSLQKNYAVVSVNSMLAALNCFFKMTGWHDCAVKTIRVQKNVFRATEREITKNDYYHLLEAAEKKGNKRLSLLMQTLCSTGIRISELEYVTVECLKLRRAVVHLKGKTRAILLPKELCRKLKSYAAERGITKGCIFIIRNGKPMDRSNVLHDMKKLCKSAGVDAEKIFPHNLRHLFAVTYYEEERDLTHLADILGHSSVNTTRIYTMSSGEQESRQIEKLKLVL